MTTNNANYTKTLLSLNIELYDLNSEL